MILNKVRIPARAIYLGVAATIAMTAMSSSGAAAHTLETVYSFCAEANCTDGSTPQGSLLRDAAGDLYGVTLSGGANGGGTVFALVPGAGGEWQHQILYSFCDAADCADGEAPIGRLIADTSGNLYGTTALGGGSGASGTVFRLMPNADRSHWKLKVLHAFLQTEGMGAEGGLSYDGAETGIPYDGTSPLYGTLCCGGEDFGGGAVRSVAKERKLEEQGDPLFRVRLGRQRTFYRSPRGAGG